jgi:hypothetical protein
MFKNSKTTWCTTKGSIHIGTTFDFCTEDCYICIISRHVNICASIAQLVEGAFFLSRGPSFELAWRKYFSFFSHSNVLLYYYETFTTLLVNVNKSCTSAGSLSLRFTSCSYLYKVCVSMLKYFCRIFQNRFFK